MLCNFLTLESQRWITFVIAANITSIGLIASRLSGMVTKLFVNRNTEFLVKVFLALYLPYPP